MYRRGCVSATDLISSSSAAYGSHCLGCTYGSRLLRGLFDHLLFRPGLLLQRPYKQSRIVPRLPAATDVVRGWPSGMFGLWETSSWNYYYHHPRLEQSHYHRIVALNLLRCPDLPSCAAARLLLLRSASFARNFFRSFQLRTTQASRSTTRTPVGSK